MPGFDPGVEPLFVDNAVGTPSLLTGTGPAGTGHEALERSSEIRGQAGDLYSFNIAYPAAEVGEDSLVLVQLG